MTTAVITAPRTIPPNRAPTIPPTFDAFPEMNLNLKYIKRAILRRPSLVFSITHRQINMPCYQVVNNVEALQK